MARRSSFRLWRSEQGVKWHEGRSARRLGDFYREGQLGFPKDIKQALQLYEEAIEWEANDGAAVMLANLYNASENFERATYWAIFASKFGNSDGLRILTDLIESGQAKFRPGYEPPKDWRKSVGAPIADKSEIQQRQLQRPDPSKREKQKKRKSR